MATRRGSCLKTICPYLLLRGPRSPMSDRESNPSHTVVCVNITRMRHGSEAFYLPLPPSAFPYLSLSSLPPLPLPTFPYIPLLPPASLPAPTSSYFLLPHPTSPTSPYPPASLFLRPLAQFCARQFSFAPASSVLRPPAQFCARQLSFAPASSVLRCTVLLPAEFLD